LEAAFDEVVVVSLDEKIKKTIILQMLDFRIYDKKRVKLFCLNEFLNVYNNKIFSLSSRN